MDAELMQALERVSRGRLLLVESLGTLVHLDRDGQRTPLLTTAIELRVLLQKLVLQAGLDGSSTPADTAVLDHAVALLLSHLDREPSLSLR